MSGPEESSDAFEQAFLNEYPNPNRIGCPGGEVLKGLASKQLPISHPARMHIGQCSPCWREFRSFEAQAKRTKRVRALVGGIAALVLILLLGPYLYWSSVRSKKDIAILTLDLRSIDPSRGGYQQHSKFQLPATVLQLSVTLPFGSDGGTYDLQLRDSDNTVSTTASGIAAIKDGGTELRVNRIDLSKVSKGEYVLTLTHGSAHLKAEVSIQ